MATEHPFRFGYLAMRPRTTLLEWQDAARSAEGGGFSTFQVSDHFDRSPAAPLPVLAAVAQVTTTVRLGTLMLDNDFRHPAVLVKELATLDVLCGGRLEIGIGAGWMHEDYRVSGIAYEPAGVRIAKLAETLEILDRVLRAAAPATVSGRHYAVEGLRSVPMPVQRPRPPLLVGGGGPRILRHADVVSVNMQVGEGSVGPVATGSATAAATDAKVAHLRRELGERRASVPLHLVAYWTAITEDRIAAAERLIALRRLPTTPEQLLDSPHALIGPRSRVVEQLLTQRERWGLSYVTCYDDDVDALAPVVAELAGR